MKKHYLLFFIFLLLTFNCKQNENEKYNQDTYNELYKEYVTTKNLNSICNIENEKLKKENENLRHLKKTQKEQIEKLNSDNAIPNVIGDFFIKDGNFLLDKPKIVEYIFENFPFNHNDFQYALFSGIPLFSGDYKATNLVDKNSLINYFYNTFDRSPESIKQLFTKPVKTKIVELFKGEIYEQYGAKNTVKSLLLAYQQIRQTKSDDFLKRLYNECNVNGYIIDLDTLPTTEIKLLLSDDNYAPNAYSTSSAEQRLFYVYSFWARRHHEGNAEIVYQLLKEFQSNIEA